MSDQKIRDWEAKKNQVKEAEYWNNLPNTKGYNNSKFEISEAHCKDLMLMRCGQHTCGGTNYWESPKALNEAIKRYIVANWDKIYQEVIADMMQRETDALKDCQEYVDKMQKLITEA